MSLPKNSPTIYPRKLVHRGSIEAKGLFFDLELMTVAEARQRVLSLWQEGMQVYNLANGLLLRFCQTKQIVCQFSQGIPLIAVGTVLIACPLDQDELKALNPVADSLVLVRGGQSLIFQLEDKYLEQVENWLNIDYFPLIKTNSLGVAPTEPTLVVEQVNFEIRDQLTKIPQQSPALIEFLSQIEQVKTVSNQPSTIHKNRFKEWLGKNLINFAENFSSFLQNDSGKTSNNLSTSNSSSIPKLSSPFLEASSQPSWLEKLSIQIKNLAAQFLLKTHLAGLIGQRQAEYISKMLELFERGDLDEALRYAIPLGDKVEQEFSTPAFRTPTPRSELKIATAISKFVRPSIGAGQDLLTELRKIYRTSFERLEAQGRIDEAAFVLAELLKSNEEAVAFLERHGKLRLAAELAEGRNLDTGIIIRQWFLAGEVSRAILIARRYRAFADAVIRLEKTNKGDAEKLRLLWANSLAETGDYSSAVSVAWSIESARSLTLEWIDRAIEVGGPKAAQMLLKKLVLKPEHYTEIYEKVVCFLEDDSLEAAYNRVQFVESFTTLVTPTNPQTRNFARLAVRAVLRDAGSKLPTISKTKFDSLVAFASDGILNADLPPFVTSRPMLLVDRHEVLKINFSALDIGTLPIKDLVLLANGQILLALGEIGARLLNKNGSTIAHFDTPAHKLVVPDQGDQVILLANRGEVWRLAKLNLLKLKVSDWCEAQIQAFAPDYDGSMWFIAAKGDFYAIDTQAKRFDALWRVPEVYNDDSNVAVIARTASYCRFIINFPLFPVKQWIYSLPKLTLKVLENIGKQVPHCKRDICQMAVFADNNIIIDQSIYSPHQAANASNPFKQPSNNFAQETEQVPQAIFIAKKFNDDYQWKEIVYDPDPQNSFKNGNPVISNEWIIAPRYYENGAKILIINTSTEKVHQEVFFGSSKQIAVRFSSNQLLSVADDKGRVLVFSLETGEIVKNLRI